MCPLQEPSAGHCAEKPELVDLQVILQCCTFWQRSVFVAPHQFIYYLMGLFNPKACYIV